MLPVKRYKAEIVCPDVSFEVVIGACYGAEWMEEVVQFNAVDQEIEAYLKSLTQEELFREVEMLYLDAKAPEQEGKRLIYRVNRNPQINRNLSYMP